MSIKSLFKKYILPHELDFIGMLQEQSLATSKMIEDLYECFISEEEQNCQSILEDQYSTERIKKRNMEMLLNAFITPIDRESIYRAVTQLDWVAISAKHFVQETKAYKVHGLTQYKEILSLIYTASQTLNEGFEALSDVKHAKVSRKADKTRALTDDISQKYIEAMVQLSENTDFKQVFIYKEILSQLKDIGHRLHISANALQDIVVKMD